VRWRKIGRWVGGACLIIASVITFVVMVFALVVVGST
jgi:uncharacterized membrane protein